MNQANKQTIKSYIFTWGWMLYASSLRPNVSKFYFGCLIDSCLSVRTIVSRMDKGGYAKVKWKAEWTKLKKLLWRE